MGVVIAAKEMMVVVGVSPVKVLEGTAEVTGQIHREDEWHQPHQEARRTTSRPRSKQSSRTPLTSDSLILEGLSYVGFDRKEASTIPRSLSVG